MQGSDAAVDHVLISGREREVYANVVVNATGPFADGVRRMSDPGCTPMIQPSSGAHVTLPDFYAGNGVGMIIPRTKDGRVLFMLPWQNQVIAGTTGALISHHLLLQVILFRLPRMPLV